MGIVEQNLESIGKATVAHYCAAMRICLALAFVLMSVTCHAFTFEDIGGYDAGGSSNDDDYEYTMIHPATTNDVGNNYQLKANIMQDAVPTLGSSSIQWKRKSAAALRKLALQILASRKMLNAFPKERKMLPRLF